MAIIATGSKTIIDLSDGKSLSVRRKMVIKEETIFFLMEEASRVGLVLEGRVQAQKSFPNGSQVNVSLRGPGELIGPAAVFSSAGKYPCDVVAAEPATVMIWS